MQKNKSFFPVFLIFFAISLLLFVLSGFGLLNGLTGFAQNLMIPLQKMTFGIVHSTAPDNNDETSKLREENKRLISQLVKQKEMEKENQALSDQFKVSNPTPRTLLPATIIGSKGSQLIIDKGESDLVKVGNTVVVKDNIIGKISKVSNHLSVIDVITRSSTSITAQTVNTTANGIAKGVGDSLIFDNVVLAEKLEKADFVVTKGEVDESGGGYPPNLVIGKIESVDKKPSSLFQSAEVRSLVDFGKLRMVFVIGGAN